jgi:hypothetical protein
MHIYRSKTVSYQIFFAIPSLTSWGLCVNITLTQQMAEEYMAIKWTEELATGVSAIDDQHKELFARINTL